MAGGRFSQILQQRRPLDDLGTRRVVEWVGLVLDARRGAEELHSAVAHVIHRRPGGFLEAHTLARLSTRFAYAQRAL